jgi:hypothetical protein
MKSKLQPIIVVLGVLSLGFGTWQMLQTRTMILPPWFLVLFYLVITFCLSFILGFLVKKILKSKWHTLTFASIFIIIICSTFYVSQYKPAYEIIVPDNYVGEVKLFVSNEKGNDFTINKYGIGYIDRETFEKGFYPKIIKGNIDITKQARGYSKGAFATTQASSYSYEYLSFSIKGESMQNNDIDELIKIRAIDTSRLYRK